MLLFFIATVKIYFCVYSEIHRHKVCTPKPKAACVCVKTHAYLSQQITTGFANKVTG